MCQRVYWAVLWDRGGWVSPRSLWEQWHMWRWGQWLLLHVWSRVHGNYVHSCLLFIWPWDGVYFVCVMHNKWYIFSPFMQGEYCEIDTNECRSGPCLNGATCYNLLNDYGCICTPGYTDYNCNSDVDECVIGICGEKGHCLVCSVCCHIIMKI